MKVISWPSHSPDLNAIELDWGYMKHQVRKHQILDEAQLEEALIDAWDNLSNDIIQDFIDHLSHRVQVVYQNHRRY